MVDPFANVDFTEESEMSSGEGLSIKEIILRHIRKISDLSCKEFTGGYWDKRPVQTRTGILYYEIYKEDVREAYCNAVDFLVDVLYPMGDKKFQEYLEGNEGFVKEKSETKDSSGQKNKKNNSDEKEIDIKEKIKKKRETFRQINKMFERINFWEGSSTVSE